MIQLIKKIILIITITTIAIGLTGCADEINSSLRARASLNIEQVDRLVASGLISESTGEQIKESIKDRINEITGKDVLTSEYISWYIKGDWTHWRSELTYMRQFPISGDTQNESGDDEVASGKKLTVDRALDVVMSNQNGLQELLGYQVHVLRAPIGNENLTLDMIMSAVNKAKNDGDFNTLSSYFTKDGKPLFDPNDTQNQLIAATKLPPERTEVIRDKETNEVLLRIRTLSDRDELGYDFTIKDTDGIPEIAIRFREFNKQAIDKLIGADNISKDKYLVNGNKVYLLEYPISYVKGFTMDNDGLYSAEYEESDIVINLISGEIRNKNGVKLEQNLDALLHVSGSGIQGELGKASFVIEGETDINGVGHDNGNIKGGRLVLRDYLEASHMSDIVDGESFVALGRSVRILEFNGDKTTKLASFVNKKGEIIDGISPIYISDIMDISSGEDEKIKLGVVEPQEDITDNTTESDTTTNGSEDTDLRPNEALLLNTIIRDNIVSTTKFPGDILNRTDVSDDTSSRIILYGIAIDKNPFETSLYSQWINKEDIENGSLVWWLRWLKENNFGYTINSDLLQQFFMGNYGYDMQKEGYIILDLEAIARIQRQYNMEDNIKEVNGFRTIFVILGRILMVYSLVLISAWTFDVAVMTGPRLLNIVSFGKWEAIQDTSELPLIETEEKQYMTFSKTLKGCIIILGVGILLMFVDIVAIVSNLIDVLGGIGEIIGDVLFSNK